MKRKIKNALLSVYDKVGIVKLARELHSLGIAMLSSGGTARMLLDNDIPVTRVSDYTGFPEMLDGRVKTLHPKIHGGILALRKRKDHVADLNRFGIEFIDIVVVNLYPFEKTISLEGVGYDEILEMIDIGGPAMVRAAAKNYRDAIIIVDPLDYQPVINMLREYGDIPFEKRHELALKAFHHTASYDTAIYSYLSETDHRGKLLKRKEPLPFPEKLLFHFTKAQELRYGENPHQRGAFYTERPRKPPSVACAQQLHGKELSFNNIMDFDAALSLVAEFRQPACAIIKHTNPCGAATGRNILTAYTRALETDPVSAFGSVIAFNRTLDKETAQAIAPSFVEGILAPEFDKNALKILSKKKNLRLLRVGEIKSYTRAGFDLRRVNGGVLVQDWDAIGEDIRKAKVATKRKPAPEELKALSFAWKIVKHVKSNAIVFTRSDRTVAIGAGQMSRVDSVKLCIQKARAPIKGSVMASDAFFPFRDGVDTAAEAGVTAVIQPGGSIRDNEVVRAADEKNLAMLITGVRHFKH